MICVILSRIKTDMIESDVRRSMELDNLKICLQKYIQEGMEARILAITDHLNNMVR